MFFQLLFSSTSATIKTIAGLGCAVLLVGMTLFSQVNTGRILGTITDQSGGVIAGATNRILGTGGARSSWD